MIEQIALFIASKQMGDIAITAMSIFLILEIFIVVLSLGKKFLFKKNSLLWKIGNFIDQHKIEHILVGIVILFSSILFVLCIWSAGILGLSSLAPIFTM